MPWIYLIAAGCLEVVWAVAMKQSDGFTRALPTTVMAVAMVGSFGLLAFAMRSLPLGTAYVIWTGIGAVGAFILGIVLFSEPVSISRVAAAGMIVAGMIVMKAAQ